MKKNILFACVLLLFVFTSIAQHCKLNIYNDWYANIGKKEYWYADTLVLYKHGDSVNSQIEIIKWMYVERSKFRPILLLNTRDGIVDPAYLWMNQWKVKCTKEKNELVIKDRKHRLKFLLKDYYQADTLYKLVLIKK